METQGESRKVTKHEIARRYGVGARTVSNWMKDKKIPWLKISARMVRFDPAEVDAALIRNHRVAAIGEAS